MAIFFNIPDDAMAIFLQVPHALMAIILLVLNTLMAICLHAHNARMRASMQDIIFPCRDKWKKIFQSLV